MECSFLSMKQVRRLIRGQNTVQGFKKVYEIMLYDTVILSFVKKFVDWTDTESFFNQQ